MTGKKITMNEIFARKRAERLLEIETPEYKERERLLCEKFQQEEAARLKWETENPPPAPFEVGRTEAEAGAKREPPDDLDDDQHDEWLRGYDSLGSDEA